MSNRIIVENVTKRFKKKIVLNHINAEFTSGKITGFVGENGSGKTVMMKLLIGLMKPSEGRILYNRKELKKEIDFLPSCGFIIENPGFYDELTGFENLNLLASVQKKISDDEIIRWIQKVGLENSGKRVGEYSLGMRQRLGIAQALMENPEVVILDEVTNSLDEAGVRLVYTLLEEERKKGKLIIISSHRRDEIDELCDEIYRFKEGKLLNEIQS